MKKETTMNNLLNKGFKGLGEYELNIDEVYLLYDIDTIEADDRWLKEEKIPVNFSLMLDGDFAIKLEGELLDYCYEKVYEKINEDLQNYPNL